MNEVTIGDKIYISSKRAAEITGYAKDYVGQLSREGHIDAKMVGRGWYVYEPSIRAHRFGEEEVVPVVTEEENIESEAPVVEKVEADSTWEKPTYKAEEPEMMPEVGSAAYKELLPPPEETLTDMQAAWREWFERRQEVFETPEIESPEIIDARNAEHEHIQEEIAGAEVEIPLHRIEEEVQEPEMTPVDDDAEEVTIRIAAPAMAPQREVQRPVAYAIEEVPLRVEKARIVNERIVRRAGENKRGATTSSAPMVALLVGVCALSIAVAVIGSGSADVYLDRFAAENPVINFLVGTKEFNRY